MRRGRLLQELVFEFVVGAAYRVDTRLAQRSVNRLDPVAGNSLVEGGCGHKISLKEFDLRAVADIESHQIKENRGRQVVDEALNVFANDLVRIKTASFVGHKIRPGIDANKNFFGLTFNAADFNRRHGDFHAAGHGLVGNCRNAGACRNRGRKRYLYLRSVDVLRIGYADALRHLSRLLLLAFHADFMLFLRGLNLFYGRRRVKLLLFDNRLRYYITAQADK